MRRLIAIALVLAGCATTVPQTQPSALKCGGKIAVLTLFAPFLIGGAIIDLVAETLAAPILAFQENGRPFASLRDLGEPKDGGGLCKD